MSIIHQKLANNSFSNNCLNPQETAMPKLLIGLLALTIVSPAMAWGDREQGILTGAAGMWLFQKFSKENSHNHNETPTVIQSVPPMQPQGNYVYTCYVQVQDPVTGTINLQQQVCMGR